ncbi:uncharacterized protein LOC123529654 isoform X2 [Mercenaria mercenaria]|uniref:uncharacterized protein LOC123529654 isoform X2 n=1 Tax=Mercenaria mercenaria TaxID=6596 RepID=UPI00234F9AC0|nr:uncharacterized protein LOC123529654 isoform X2 [Mercenaria mercenaria]
MTGIFHKYFNTYLTIWLSSLSVTSGGSDWQLCFDKCYYLTSKIKVTFEDQKAVCQSMGSRPVDFGSKQEQTLAAELSTYRLVKFDGQPYWINKRNTVNNTGIPSCRTITFSGNGIHLEQDVSCSALSHPFCENDISFCQSSRKNNTLTHDWVKVGQSNYYHLSYSTHTYCDAKTFCQKVLHGKIASVGNHSFMGLLAIKLGISGTTKLDVWLDSSGNSCPSGSGLGNVMRYTGPLVHLIEMRNTSENFRVLCETNTITNSTQITSSLQTTITTRTTKPIRHSTTHLATVKSSTSTRIPQTYTVSPSTQSGVPQTTQYQSSSTTRLQSALVSRQATSAKRPQSISTTPQQLALTITQQEASATLKQSTTTTLLQSASTADHQATSTTQAQPQVESSTRIQTTSTTGLQAVSITRIQAASTTKSSAASTTSQHATKPAAMSSVPRHREAKKLAVSRTSDPEWLKVSLNEYFINYKSSTYRQSGHISTNYFKILPNSNADSFWIGAHTVRDEEPSDTGITYIPYKNEPVRFSLTKEQVQGMWKELRQQRNANKNAKSP